MSIDWNQFILTKTSDKQALLDALANAGCAVLKPNSIRCGFHEDKNPSGGVYQKDGHWRYKCHSCGMNEDWFGIVAEKSGLHRNEVIKQYVKDKGGGASPAPAPRQEPKQEVKTWPSPKSIYDWLKTKCEKVKPYRYINPETKQDDLVVYRCEPALGGNGRKGFIQATPYNGAWALRGVEGKLPLYNRPGLADAENVVLVEGEKAADALVGIGICATTAPGGAGKDAADVDWSPLQGKAVYLWPDNDEPGVAHMEKVAAAIEHVAEKVILVPAGVLDLPEKGDAYDAVEYLRAQGCDDKAIRRAIVSELMDAKPSGPADEVLEHLEDQISGKFRAVPFGEWESLSSSTRALLPGKVTVICGDPGDGKSFLLLQSAVYWMNQEEERVAIFELEDDKRFHLSRVLAQQAGSSEMLDDRWVKANPDDARERWSMHAGTLDNLGRSMWECPDKILKLSDLGEWVRQRCEEGCRIVAIDPITMTTTSERRFEDDLDFVVTVKNLARQYEVSVVLIMHPKKGGGKDIGLDSLAGGAAYARFTHTVLWIRKWEKPKTYRVKSSNMFHLAEEKTVRCNRTIYNCKTRNGPGAGLQIGFNFDHNTLRFKEEGVVVEEVK